MERVELLFGLASECLCYTRFIAFILFTKIDQLPG